MIRLTTAIVTAMLCGTLTDLSAQTMIKLKNVTLTPSTCAQAGSGIQNITDGKWELDREIFHTLWDGMPKQNVVIEADLEGVNLRLDQIRLIPRANGLNGIIKKAQVFVMTQGQFRQVATLDLPLSNQMAVVELEEEILNPEKIRLVVTDAYSFDENKKYMVSLGDLQCAMLAPEQITRVDLQRYGKLFNDKAATTLRSGLKALDLAEIKSTPLRLLVAKIQDGVYSPGPLLQQHQATVKGSMLAQKCRIVDGFSKFEGITGVMLEQGEHFVFVQGSENREMYLQIPDWLEPGVKDKDPMDHTNGGDWSLKTQVFKLQEGINRLELKKGGLAYLQYLKNPDEVTPSITVHFPTGKFNNYFDLRRGDTNTDFDRLLDQAVSPILDLRGEFVQIAFPVESLKKFTRSKGLELVKNYDRLVGLQRDLLGWTKEGLKIQNPLLIRVQCHYYMFRDGWGVAYHENTMNSLANPEQVIKGDPCWGTSHEIGHVNQMKPQLNWGGMGEVSNNIFTLYCTTYFGNRSRLSEENVYERARKNILDRGISYLDLPGPVGPKATQYGGDGNTDVFERLVPFWQLHLYFTEQGYKDFYADLMIAMRKQTPKSQGQRNKEYLDMLEFCRLACEVSKTDLTEFFERWGFFYVGDIDVIDYGRYDYKVSVEDVKKVKQAIADMKLPKPVKDITLMQD